MAEFPEILSTCRFYLELKLEGSNDSVDGYFMECSGFKVSQDVVEIAQVTPQKWGKDGKAVGRVMSTKVPGNNSFTNLVLKRGLTCSMTFWNWLQAIQDGDWAGQRRDGSLVIYDQAANAQFRMEFQGAWPVSYAIADLNAAGGDLEVEEVEIAVEDLKRVKIEGGDAN